MTTSNTTTTTTDITRTQPVMKNAEIKKAAHKLGFTYSRLITCPSCRAEVLATYGKDVPPWVNVGIALYFTKKGHNPIVACRCGHRSTMKMNFKNSDKIRCKVRGCNHVLNKSDSDGLCYPCRKEIAGGGNPALWSQHCTATLTRNGCNFYIQGGNEECVRTACIYYQPNGGTAPQAAPMETIPPTNMGTAPPAAPAQDVPVAPTQVRICNRKGCNNPVPIDRKAVCYECVPPRTEAVM